jgi:hypothetical protein
MLMDSEGPLSNWLEAANLFISKCDTTSLQTQAGSQTSYAKPWDCVFILEDTASLGSASVSRANDDEVQAFLNKIYHDSRPIAFIHASLVRRSYRKNELQDPNVRGGTIVSGDRYELSDDNEAIRCLIREVSNNLANIAHISTLLNSVAGNTQIGTTSKRRVCWVLQLMCDPFLSFVNRFLYSRTHNRAAFRNRPSDV